MAQVIRRLHLSRRTFLRGAGASLALPWLDAMTPGLGTAPKPPLRTAFLFLPNGVNMSDWTPQQSGRGYDLPSSLDPLSNIREDLLVLSQLAIDGGRAHGDGPGDHARSAGSYLTCAHPRKTGGADIHCGISVDQVISQAIGKKTHFPSLELGMEAGRSAGNCDSGYSCAYSSNISWRTPTTPVAKEVDPKALFARLFGDPNSLKTAAAQAARQREIASILDVTLTDARSLRGRLDRADQAKLDQYLTAIREIELRIEKGTKADGGKPIPEGLLDRVSGTGSYLDQLRVTYELMTLAFQADLTRTITFMIGNAGSNRSYRWIDVPQGHHSLSHHGNKPEKLSMISKINRFQVEEFARFIGRMKKIEDGPGNLLDHSLICLGSGLGDGNRHDHMNLPMLLAGHGNGTVRTGRHLVFPKNTPMANLYLTLIRANGLRLQGFADSTSPLKLS